VRARSKWGATFRWNAAALVGQVDLVLGATEREPHRLIRRANVPAGAFPRAGLGDRPVTVTLIPGAGQVVPAAFCSSSLTGTVVPLLLALAVSYWSWTW